MPGREGWLPLLFCFALLCALTACGGCDRSSPKGDGAKPAGSVERYVEAMQTGKNYYEKNEFQRALPLFEEAVRLEPASFDARLNLANTLLGLNQAGAALKEAQEAITLQPDEPAGYYVAGVAHLREGRAQEAVTNLQVCVNLDQGIAAAAFQLGLAHMQLRQWPEAIAQFETTLSLEPKHPAAHYNLAQALLRENRTDEAQAHLEQHQALQAASGGAPLTAEALEKSIYTSARAPFVLEQPDAEGVAVTFTDRTAEAFGELATNIIGPVGVVEVNHRGAQDLFARVAGQGFQLLWNSNSVFAPTTEPLPAIEGANYHKLLVGDLDNNRHEDVVALSDRGVQVFRFATNAFVIDATPMTRLQGLATKDAALADIDFTGKLDLVAVSAGTNDVRVFRNLANMMFREITSTSGVPNLTNALAIALDDWNNDDLADLFIVREGSSPLSYAKQRGGGFVSTNYSASWPAATAVALGDLNNDLRMDAALVSEGRVRVIYTAIDRAESLEAGGAAHIELWDYDNDGWLDIVAYGERFQVWRNRGNSGFEERTSALKLDQLRNIAGLAKADFDGDCDTDLVLWAANRPVRFLRNEGGNQNKQLKLWLWGNRSNNSGLGIRVEAVAGSWRTIRTIQELPVEIGVGNREKLDSMTLRWFDLSQPFVDVGLACTNIFVAEQVLPTGSCPYVYVWDGEEYRFVSDILGAAPLGLPVADGVYIEADTDEYVWLGNESSVKPREGYYTIQITEELRETLYLDEAKLVVVDHPASTEVHPTDKLLPRKPYPPGTIIATHKERSLRNAVTLSGRDVTRELLKVDKRMVSPDALLIPQYRGRASRHGVILDFGELETDRPLALAMTGWLRFGGGMANISASLNPELPFPFPTLEAELPDGSWQAVDVVVGAPAGKTKRMVVDLEGKLPEGARRLKLETSFEIHWDRIALTEKFGGSIKITRLSAAKTDLHWRGFSEFAELPWDQPLTPVYAQVKQQPPWRITPMGWHTRYGPVDELLSKTDDALVLMNGGDELTLSFDASSLPPKPEGWARDFFLFTDGWDKDADYHVAQGWRVDPLPHHGQDDQKYGSVEYPPSLDGSWMKKYNTRWVHPLTLKRAEPAKR